MFAEMIGFVVTIAFIMSIVGGIMLVFKAIERYGK